MNEFGDPNKESAFEKVINYEFKHPNFRTRALTSKSWFNENKDHEFTLPGLETLGDAVIGLCVVYHHFSQDKEKGEITIDKSAEVKRKNHNRIAKDINLTEFMNLGNGENTTEDWKNGDSPGEFLEGVLGAIFHDQMKANEDGIGACTQVLKHIGLMK